MDNLFQQLKMFLWNKIGLYFNGFFSFLKKKKKSTTALNKNAHRMGKSSDLAVQNTEEVMTALGHFGLRCYRRCNEQLGIS